MNQDKKIALITGITGQDGSYLAEYLLNKGYIVHGAKRRTSLFNTARIDHIFKDRHEESVRFFLHYSDMTDTANLIRIIKETQPDEIYNLAAMSHVHVSFEVPEYSANVDGLGVLRILEAIRLLDMKDKTRFYQASTSELYGAAEETPQNENTPFRPRSPYAIAKLYAHWITVGYREGYGIHASNGIFFNHESPVRGENFVTRKITRALASMAYGFSDVLYLGNLDAKRDWGHAKDYVEAMYLMMQQPEPDDYVIATGKSHSVRDFVLKAFNKIGVRIEFSGKGMEEKGFIAQIDREKLKEKTKINKVFFKQGDFIIEILPEYFRPTEVNVLQGDSSKAKKKFGWEPRYTLDGLIEEMVDSDLEANRRKFYNEKHFNDND